jgi:serine/threonine-protein kinase PknK
VFSAARTPTVLPVLALALWVAGCGSSSSSSRATTVAQHRHPPARKPPPVALRAAGPLSLPDAREGTATALYGGDAAIVSGGLSAAGVSTSTVFRIDSLGHASSVASLPGPIHDAAAAEVAGRLLVFGGGQFEGSNRIVQVLPGQPRQVGTLPQALSDLDAGAIGNVAYVAGGWNGSATNPDIYAARPDGSVIRVGTLPIGVRYPAVGALGGKLVVAGGETSAGTPTTTASVFDPATGRVTGLPALPVPTDHAAGAVLGGRFYLIGGLREGVFTDAILSWAPGDSRWRLAGHLPAALADLAAVPFDGGIAVLGGRGASGTVASGTLLKPG